MEIKDLNKSQLILLAILISFITSIATGIVTVTLLQQAPASFTAPINRVVKETVEKIVPGESKVQTVVVKEEDLVVDAIAKNQASVFSVSKEGFDLDGNKIEIPIGKGLAVSKDNILVTDASVVAGPDIYYVKNDSGKYKADFISADKNGFSFLKIGNPLDEKNKLTYSVPIFRDLSKMKTGQKIIVLGNGTVSSFIYDGVKEIKINNVKSNAGAVALDLDGNVLGIVLASDTVSFAPIDEILNSLKNITAPKV